MGRGVIFGVVAGLLASALALSLVSVLFPPPGVPLAPGVTTAPAAPTAAPALRAAPGSPAAPAEPRPSSGTAPAVATPEARPALPGVDASPTALAVPAAPAPGAAPLPAGEAAPALADGGAASAPGLTAPAAIIPPAAAPAVPGVDVAPAAPTASPAPAVGAAPVSAPEGVGPVAPVASAPAIAAAPQPDLVGAADKGAKPPAASARMATPGTATVAEAAPPAPVPLAPAPAAGAAPGQPLSGAAPDQAPGAMANTPPGPTPTAPLPQQPPMPGALPKAAELLDPAHPQILGLKPVPGVKVNRLPQVGGSTQPATLPGAVAAPLTETAVAAPPQVDPPVRRYAVNAANPEGKPGLAVILIDDGSAADDRRALATTLLPVSFAVDPTAGTAEDASRTYRDGGHEVLVLAAAIPTLSTPSDLAQTFAAYFRTVPEAVAVIDSDKGGFQDNRMMAQRIVAILTDDGYGLVTYDRGMNAAAQLAGQGHLPTARVFARLDGAPETMTRTLDRAAFRAAQDGGATVAAPASAETLALIADWLRGPRGATVALVPVTAVMGN